MFVQALPVTQVPPVVKPDGGGPPPGGPGSPGAVPKWNRPSVKLVTMSLEKLRFDPPYAFHTPRPELVSGGFITEVLPENGMKLIPSMVILFWFWETKT